MNFTQTDMQRLLRQKLIWPLNEATLAGVAWVRGIGWKQGTECQLGAIYFGISLPGREQLDCCQRYEKLQVNLTRACLIQFSLSAPSSCHRRRGRQGWSNERQTLDKQLPR